MPDWLSTVTVIGGFVGTLATLAAMWKIFMDQGESGWISIVPFYNFWLINKWNGNPGWAFIALFLPYLGTAYVAFLFFQLCRNYGRSVGFSLGGALLSPIFLPILAFGRGGPSDSRAEYSYAPPVMRDDHPSSRSAASARPAQSGSPAPLPRDLMAPPSTEADAARVVHPRQPPKTLNENPDALPELVQFDDEMRTRLAAGESVADLSWELLDRTHEISRRDVVAHLQRLQ